MTDTRRDADDDRPTAEEMLARTRGGGRRARARPAAGLSRHGTGGRQDVPDARGGPPPDEARDRPRRRVRRGARASRDREAPRRARDRAAAARRVPRRRRRGDGHRRRPGARARRGPRRRARPYQRARVGAGQALGGRERPPRRRASMSSAPATSSTSNSVADAVATITGAPVNERIPDEVLAAADEVELVDMSPFALRQRMRHGNVYAEERARVALDRFFTESNLTALRELALRFVAGRVDAQLEGIGDRPAAPDRERARPGARGPSPATPRALRRAAATAAGSCAPRCSRSSSRPPPTSSVSSERAPDAASTSTTRPTWVPRSSRSRRPMSPRASSTVAQGAA